MASRAHDFIVALVARKVLTLGFQIVYLEGSYCRLVSDSARIPPRIIRHRPDVIGIDSCGADCIGEAKTTGDLGSQRTREELEDYSRLLALSASNALVVGYPTESHSAVLALLASVGLAPGPTVHLLRVPSALLPTTIEEDE